MEIPRIDPKNLGVLLIDVQTTFLEYAFPGKDQGHEALLVRLEHLLMMVDWMNLPMIATFEKPVDVHGELPARLEAVFPGKGQRFVKNYFGCMTEPDIKGAIKELGVQQFAVAGAETDVCILQSVLGLRQSGYQVFLLEDCTFTSETQPGPALRRMYQAGAIPCTLKSMLYELVACVDHTPWYPEGWVLLDHPDTRQFPENFITPEDWPDWESVL